jgi:hypothetical protein
VKRRKPIVDPKPPADRADADIENALSLLGYVGEALEELLLLTTEALGPKEDRILTQASYRRQSIEAALRGKQMLATAKNELRHARGER